MHVCREALNKINWKCIFIILLPVQSDKVFFLRSKKNLKYNLLLLHFSHNFPQKIIYCFGGPYLNEHTIFFPIVTRTIIKGRSVLFNGLCLKNILSSSFEELTGYIINFEDNFHSFSFLQYFKMILFNLLKLKINEKILLILFCGFSGKYVINSWPSCNLNPC